MLLCDCQVLMTREVSSNALCSPVCHCVNIDSISLQNKSSTAQATEEEAMCDPILTECQSNAERDSDGHLKETHGPI